MYWKIGARIRQDVLGEERAAYECAWPGATSANSSARLLGSCTMPVTRQVVPAACQVPPTCAPYRVATWLVSAAWPGRPGMCR